MHLSGNEQLTLVEKLIFPRYYSITIG